MFNPTIRRFVWLYVRSRHLLPIIVGAMLLLAFATWWANDFADGIKAQNDQLALRLQLATIAPLIAGALIGLTAASPSGELDDAAPKLPRRARLGLTIGVLLLLGGLYLVTGRTWAFAGADLVLTRNLAGWTGLTMMALPLLGTSRAWMPTIAWAGVSLFANDPQTVDYPAWAWTMQPGDDRTALLIAATLLPAGIVVLALTPFRTRTE